MKHFQSISLKNNNTLKIDVKADNVYILESMDDVNHLADNIDFRDEKYMILGQGANILFTDDFKGSIVQVAHNQIGTVDESDKYVVLAVDAGCSWHDLVTHTVSHGWGGIENMALIPGLVGAAPIGNIAAYGQNFSDVCESVTAFEYESGNIVEITAKDCGFVYRDSKFKNQWKNKYLILRVRMKLSKNPIVNEEYWSKKHGSVGDVLKEIAQEPYSVEDVFNAIIKLRTQKFPDMNMLGTAGSFFKNPLVHKDKLNELRNLVPNVQYYPVTGLHYIDNKKDTAEDYVKVAAGEILDSGMNYKNLWKGNVGLYENHALVLVTNGKATGKEVDEFASMVQNDFQEYCGIPLEREVITISNT